MGRPGEAYVAVLQIGYRQPARYELWWAGSRQGQVLCPTSMESQGLDAICFAFRRAVRHTVWVIAQRMEWLAETSSLASLFKHCREKR
jgi:hypothetical protein